MHKKRINIIVSIVIILLTFIGGFFLGRSRIKTKEIIKTEYIKGDMIQDTIYSPTPIYVSRPIDTLNIIKQSIKDGIYKELWPEKVITEYIEITKEDTAKIINDWASLRAYEETLFDNDTIGNCNVKVEVQYNRLKYLSYNYEPITKIVTRNNYIVKTFSPFIGVGYMTNPYDKTITLTGGAFYKEKHGIQLNFMRCLEGDRNYVGINYLYKF